MNNIGPVSDRKESTKNEASQTMDVGVSGAYKMGPVEYLQMMYANNPDAQLIPCVSMITMEKQDIIDFAHFLLDDKTTEMGKKRASLGIENPVKVYYWELTNEIDGYWKARQDWYIAQAKVFCEAIRSVYPNAKICACGPTAPWGRFWNMTEEDSGYWTHWHKTIMPELAQYVDAISFHPYYDGYSSEFVMMFIDTMKKDIDAVVAEQGLTGADGKPKNISVLCTESSRFWDIYDTLPGSVMFQAAISTSHFFNLCFARDYVVGSTYHNITGFKFLAFFMVKDGEFFKSSTEKLYELYNDNLGDRVVDTKWDYYDEADKPTDD